MGPRDESRSYGVPCQANNRRQRCDLGCGCYPKPPGCSRKCPNGPRILHERSYPVCSACYRFFRARGRLRCTLVYGGVWWCVPLLIVAQGTVFPLLQQLQQPQVHPRVWWCMVVCPFVNCHAGHDGSAASAASAASGAWWCMVVYGGVSLC
jgi:hypothetical protein